MPLAPDLSGVALDARYELHELIGEGTFGRVYRGRDRRLDRAVAVKVIKPWWAEEPEWLRRFEREARLLARVNHPGIVQIFDVGRSREGLYYVSELVEGESLAERLRRGPLRPHGAALTAQRLSEALAEAHRRGIVHRDVKPANVLLGAGGAVKVGDFGLALLAEGSSESATVAGTPAYMAPEQARGRPASPASDVYAVGVVLYEMLAGVPPFTAGAPVEVALRHLEDPPPPLPPSVAPSLAAVVGRALAKEPRERFSDAGEMAQALARAQTPTALGHGRRAAAGSGSTWLAPKLAPRRHFDPPARRRRLGLLALVLGLAGAMALAALLLNPGGKVRVPSLAGQGARHAELALRRLGLRAARPLRRYQRVVPAGVVIAQAPRPGALLSSGAAVSLTLSAGPPPVQVPPLDGENRLDAESALRAAGLRGRFDVVPAPGQAPGTVVHQTPAAGVLARAGSSVTLAVAEAPRWRTIRSLAGSGGGSLSSFSILGRRFRIVYSLRYLDDCTFWFLSFCSGPSVRVVETPGGGTVASFGLDAGRGQTQTINAGPGSYELRVTAGGDPARWALTVEDDY
jgi:hypothetical protein